MLLHPRSWGRTGIGARLLPFLLLLLVAGCGGGAEEDSPGAPSTSGSSAATVQLTGAGATFPEPVYSKWFSTYHEANKSVTINYQGLGSGAGIQQLKNETVDFGASDAPLSVDEAREMPRPVVQIPTVGGAVAVTYNLEGVGSGLKITPETLSEIFQGTIKRWNDPAIAANNPDKTLPDIPILVTYRSDGSGTTFLFTHYLAAVSPKWKDSVGAGKSVKWPTGQGGKGNAGVTQVVKQTPGAIGYVELAFALTNKMPYASIRNLAGQFVTPDVKSITAALAGSLEALKKDIKSPVVNAAGPESYPIAGLTYLLLFQEQKDAARGKALTDFLQWAFKDGGKDAEALHYAPLPPDLVALNETSLKSLTANGSPLASR